MAVMAAEHVLKPAAAAAYLGVSQSTLYRLVKAGKLRRAKLAPQTARYEVAELDRFLREASD
jgi:excisionase family DNA binding protein